MAGTSVMVRMMDTAVLMQIIFPNLLNSGSSVKVRILPTTHQWFAPAFSSILGSYLHARGATWVCVRRSRSCAQLGR